MTTNDAYARFRAKPNACPKCWGCGQIANDDDESAWSIWEDMVPPENVAVLIGLVGPLECPACGGTGERSEEHTAARMEGEDRINAK